MKILKITRPTENRWESKSEVTLRFVDHGTTTFDCLVTLDINTNIAPRQNKIVQTKSIDIGLEQCEADNIEDVLERLGRYLARAGRAIRRDQKDKEKLEAVKNLISIL